MTFANTNLYGLPGAWELTSNSFLLFITNSSFKNSHQKCARKETLSILQPRTFKFGKLQWCPLCWGQRTVSAFLRMPYALPCRMARLIAHCLFLSWVRSCFFTLPLFVFLGFSSAFLPPNQRLESCISHHQRGDRNTGWWSSSGEWENLRFSAFD